MRTVLRSAVLLMVFLATSCCARSHEATIANEKSIARIEGVWQPRAASAKNNATASPTDFADA